MWIRTHFDTYFYTRFSPLRNAQLIDRQWVTVLRAEIWSAFASFCLFRLKRRFGVPDCQVRNQIDTMYRRVLLNGAGIYTYKLKTSFWPSIWSEETVIQH
jgi:hypothetical protein